MTCIKRMFNKRIKVAEDIYSHFFWTTKVCKTGRWRKGVGMELSGKETLLSMISFPGLEYFLLRRAGGAPGIVGGGISCASYWDHSLLKYGFLTLCLYEGGRSYLSIRLIGRFFYSILAWFSRLSFVDFGAVHNTGE